MFIISLEQCIENLRARCARLRNESSLLFTLLCFHCMFQVGEDLTEGEAHVLEEYGWVRNTGLGTMVNYRDRVVHDRWTEKCVADWRAKIGKLLMIGYAEGQSVTTHGPKKIVDLLEATGDAELEIKLEDPY